MNHCPGCGRKSDSFRFCTECAALTKQHGIDNQPLLNALPERERRTMMLPIAQEIAVSLTCRPALTVLTR